MIVFRMSTKQGEKFEFSYSGYMKYKPNKSSTSGYGSDDWFYLCFSQDESYMLIFSDDAGYGTIWECFQLVEGESEKLENAEIDLWIDIYFKKRNRFRISGLHLDNIDEVRAILPKCSRCYNFNDQHYRGMY